MARIKRGLVEAGVTREDHRTRAVIARHDARRRLVCLLAASGLLHGLLLLFMTWPTREPAVPASELPASVAMVFEARREGQRAVPTPDQVEMPTLPTPPAEPPPAAPSERAAALPIPPPSSAVPVPPPSSSPARPRPPRPPPKPETSFPAPLNYSFGPGAAAGPPAPSAANPAWGPAVRGEMSFGQFARITQGHVDASWINRLQDWWGRHGYYPSQAAALQQDGKVRIELVVDRYGKVRSVELAGRSGSPWLDMGAQAVFRGAELPPFPPNSGDDRITLELTINYVLVRR